MFKIAVNQCYGGFNLSDKAVEMLAKLKNIDISTKLHKPDADSDEYITLLYPQDRADPDLIKVIETLGKEASGSCSSIAIEEVPVVFRDTYVITEYDGVEGINYLPNHVAMKWLADGKIVVEK